MSSNYGAILYTLSYETDVLNIGQHSAACLISVDLFVRLYVIFHADKSHIGDACKGSARVCEPFHW